MNGRWVEKQREKWTQLWNTEDPALLVAGVLVASTLFTWLNNYAHDKRLIICFLLPVHHHNFEKVNVDWHYSKTTYRMN